MDRNVWIDDRRSKIVAKWPRRQARRSMIWLAVPGFGCRHEPVVRWRGRPVRRRVFNEQAMCRLSRPRGTRGFVQFSAGNLSFVPEAGQARLLWLLERIDNRVVNGCGAFKDVGTEGVRASASLAARDQIAPQSERHCRGRLRCPPTSGPPSCAPAARLWSDPGPCRRISSWPSRQPA